MRRRGRGEGGIGRRPDGTWYATVSLGTGPDGKRARKYFYGDSKAEVTKARDHWASNHGKDFDPSSEKLKDYLPTWLETRTELRTATRTSYELMISHMLPIIGEVAVGAVQPAHVEHLLASLRTAGKSPRIQELCYIVLKLALRGPLEQDRIAKDPFRGVARPKPVKKTFNVWTTEQRDAFLAGERDNRWWPLWVTALWTGMRQGELLGLQWSDVDLKTGRAVVGFQLNEVNGRILGRTKPKTKSGDRTVTLLPPVVAALRVQRERLLAAGHAASPWVFPNTDGGPCRKAPAQESFQRAVGRAGLPYMRFHDMRHTFATIALKAGMDLKTVSVMLGHADVVITMRTYQHVDEDMQRQEVQKLLGPTVRGATDGGQP